MAHALSLEVIAEGVETEQQARALQELRCELAQGFHFHRPLSAEEVTALLAEPYSTQTSSSGSSSAPARISASDGARRSRFVRA